VTLGYSNKGYDDDILSMCDLDAKKKRKNSWHDLCFTNNLTVGYDVFLANVDKLYNKMLQFKKGVFSAEQL
jgi:hypothetical protein